MSERSDLERVFVRWFEDGPSTMPGRVIDVVADRIGHQRQRPAWRPQGRLPMNTFTKIIAGLAAGLVVAFVGWNLLPKDPDGSGGRPTPTAATAPSREAIGTPSPGPSQRWWEDAPGEACGLPVACAGELAPGTHTSGSFQPAITYTVPAGWVNTADWNERDTYFALTPDTPAARAAAAAGDAPQPIVIVTDLTLASSMCTTEGAPQGGVGLSAAEIAGALTTREGISTTAPVTVTIGGYTGLQLDTQLDAGWSGMCSYLATPAVPLVGNWEAQGDNRHRIIILDTSEGSNLAIVVFAPRAADFEPVLASVMPIIESIEFGPTPESS